MSRLASDKQGRLMPGVVSLGEYAIYWIGLVVITIGVIVATAISWIRGRSRRR
jgi:hypothetical protein